MNRLSYLQKFSLIGLLFLLPIGLTLYLLISDLNAQIKTVELELKGTEYNATVRHFMEDIQLHRDLSNIVIFKEMEFAESSHIKRY
jgi:uncharacterized membrane protein